MVLILVGLSVLIGCGHGIEGNKIIARGDFGLMIPSPLVFTTNDDGTIQGPKDTVIPRLEKVK